MQRGVHPLRHSAGTGQRGIQNHAVRRQCGAGKRPGSLAGAQRKGIAQALGRAGDVRDAQKMHVQRQLKAQPLGRKHALWPAQGEQSLNAVPFGGPRCVQKPVRALQRLSGAGKQRRAGKRRLQPAGGGDGVFVRNQQHARP